MPSLQKSAVRPQPFDPRQNYRTTLTHIGYVAFEQATQPDYQRIVFMSGLEVHQQLKTQRKLFCRCPTGRFQKDEEYDAEVIRHMRPTLSELGEYDGTALMEFKTRKEIIYRIKNETCCTYEVDDTPPFPIDPEVVNIAIEISLLKKIRQPLAWQMQHLKVDAGLLELKPRLARLIKGNNWQLHLEGLPGFRRALSHFTQPGKIFADEISDRLKVITCLEKPNMDCSESLKPLLGKESWVLVKKLLGARAHDALLVFWGPEADVAMAWKP